MFTIRDKSLLFRRKRMKRGRFERRKEKPKAGKIILIVIAVLVVLVGIVAAAGVAYYNYALSKIEYVEVPKIQTTTAPTETEVQEETEVTEEPTAAPTETVHIPSSEDYINFLVVGQAAREGEEDRMADSMILVTLNTHEKTVTLTSILRDTVVQYGGRYKNHNYGGAKINTMYHLGYVWDGVAGSMAIMNQILYDNFGIEVDYNIEISFDVFIDFVDAMGGIEVDLTQEEADYLNGDDGWVERDIEPGLQLLEGREALCYVRMRKAAGDGESDIKRTARQRAFVGAVLEKLKDLTPSKLQNIVDRTLARITTSMTKDEITDTLLLMLPMVTELEMKQGGVCPAHGWGDMVDIYGDGMYHSVIKFNIQQTKKEMRAITEGEFYE